MSLNETEYIKNKQIQILNKNPELKKAHNILDSLLSILKPVDIYYDDYRDIAVKLKREYGSLDVDSLICRMFQWFENYHITNNKKHIPYELSFLNLLMHLNQDKYDDEEYIFFTYDLFALFIEKLNNEIKLKSKKPFKAKKLCNDYLSQLNYAKKVYNYGIIDFSRGTENQNSINLKNEKHTTNRRTPDDEVKGYMAAIDVSRMLYEGTINELHESVLKDIDVKAIINISSFEFIAFYISLSKLLCTEEVAKKVKYQCDNVLLCDMPDSVKEFFDLRVQSYSDLSANNFEPIGFKYLTEPNPMALTKDPMCNKFILYLYDCLHYAATNEDVMLNEFNGMNVVSDFTKSITIETAIVKTYIQHLLTFVTNLF